MVVVPAMVLEPFVSVDRDATRQAADQDEGGQYRSKIPHVPFLLAWEHMPGDVDRGSNNNNGLSRGFPRD
jgi:hypothetical protein